MLALVVAVAGARTLTAQRAPVISVFIVAHPDDWQLFMGDVAVRQLERNDRALFIIMSAGDAGRPAAYWHAREDGALASMHAALALAGKPAGRAATRFLRLPDGRPDGDGFPATQQQSMQKLERRLLPRLTSLDSTARFTDARQLVDTLRAIVRRETAPGLLVQMHTHDPDVRVNPGDHADHRSVGRLALALGRAMHVPIMLYAGYVNIRRADNLSATDAARKAYLFVRYDRARMTVTARFSAYCENPWAHVLYLSRTYARPAPIPDGLLFKPLAGS